MQIQNTKDAGHSRARLSLRFSEKQAQQSTFPLPRAELQRIVAEMLG